MVLGIGIDIIEIEREKRREGGRKSSLSRKNKYQHLAARFAAKEAIYKALSSDTDKAYSWQDIEIFNEPNGLPKVKLFGALKDYLVGCKRLQNSMSHSENYVTCVAILSSTADNL